MPNNRLRDALRSYILEEREPEGICTVWVDFNFLLVFSPPFKKKRQNNTQSVERLFPHRRWPLLRVHGLAAHVVRLLSRRTAISGISPHTFRRYVVNVAMRAGNRLEAVSKWLGHSQTVTTSRFYWTDDATILDIQVPMLNRTNQGRVEANGILPIICGNQNGELNEGSEDQSTEREMAECLVEATNEIVRLRNTLNLTLGVTREEDEQKKRLSVKDVCRCKIQ